MSDLNQIPLWCRECGGSYMSFDDEGVCQICDTPNVLTAFLTTLVIPVEGWSADQVRHNINVVVSQAIFQGILPDGTGVSDVIEVRHG